MNVDAIEVIHTFGEAVGLAAMFFTNIIFIRSFLLVSSCVFLVTGYFVGLQAMAVWSFFYILINGGQIILLLASKRHIELTPIEKRLHRVLTTFSRKEVIEICRAGLTEVISPSTLQLMPTESVRFIFQGEAFGYKKDKCVSRVGKSHFIGHRYSTTQKSIKWRNMTPLCCYRWDESRLKKILKKNPDLYNKFVTAIQADALARSGI